MSLLCVPVSSSLNATAPAEGAGGGSVASKHPQCVGLRTNLRQSAALQDFALATVAGNPHQVVPRTLSPLPRHASSVRVGAGGPTLRGNSGSGVGVRRKHDSQGIPRGRSSNSSSPGQNDAEQNAVRRPEAASCSGNSNTCTTRRVSLTTPGSGRPNSRRTVIAHPVALGVRRGRTRSGCSPPPPDSDIRRHFEGTRRRTIACAG
jgi:hypothetical protein